MSTQTPDSNEQLKQKVLSRILKDYGITQYAVPMADDIMRFLAAHTETAVQQASKELLSNYEAMFQKLINLHGYEKARAIKDAIEARTMFNAERQQDGKEQ